MQFSRISDNTLHSAGACAGSDASCLFVSFMFSSHIQCEHEHLVGGELMASGHSSLLVVSQKRGEVDFVPR